MSVDIAISDLRYARQRLLNAVARVPVVDAERFLVNEKWDVKDLLAHLAGWDEHVLRILPCLLEDCADEISPLDVDAHNRKSVEARAERSVEEVVAEMRQLRETLLRQLEDLAEVELEMRRTRRGQTYTIRSYVVDTLVEHELQHAIQLERLLQSGGEGGGGKS